MDWVLRLAKSSIGAKVAMAISGLALYGFVIAHVLANLQIFVGPEPVNHYGYYLRTMPMLLWTARIGLLVAALVHVVSGIRLAVLNRRARPVRYKAESTVKASFASLTMAQTGILLLVFIIFHLAHYTWHLVDPAYGSLVDSLGRHDVYQMMVLGFSNVWVSATYIVAMVMLHTHLSHGASSMFQSLGINHPRYNGLLRKVGPVTATLIVAGFISIPVAVLAGLVK
jgi:succinate dehydrogenase / fumarate reductase, cytochrome b subunit